MKHQRILSLILAGMLALSILPCAMATDIPEEETIDYNASEIENNYGTIVNNTAAGTVENNYCDIEKNLGTVENNKNGGESKRGMITDNDGEVGQNDAIIMNNNGEVTTNFDGAVINNYGTVDVNKGTGSVYNNHGEILENRADVGVNRQDGTVTNAKDSTGAAVMINYGIVENASIIEMEGMELLPFGEGVAAGTDTVVGISYARDGVDVHLGGMWDDIAEQTGEAGFNPVEQYVATGEEDYVIKDYAEFEQYLGEIESGKKFAGWKGSDGKKYKPGDLYSKLSPLQLTAIIKAIQKAEKKSASKAPSLTIHINEDGSFSVKGGSINNFIAVTVDDELVDPINYTLATDENGRMMILFTDAFLQSLAAGEHPVMLCFSNGTSHSTLNV